MQHVALSQRDLLSLLGSLGKDIASHVWLAKHMDARSRASFEADKRLFKRLSRAHARAGRKAKNAHRRNSVSVASVASAGVDE